MLILGSEQRGSPSSTRCTGATHNAWASRLTSSCWSAARRSSSFRSRGCSAARRPRCVGVRGRLPDVPRGLRDQRPALRGHVPPLLQGRPEAARFGDAFAPRSGFATSSRASLVPLALAAWAIVALATRSARDAGLDDPAHVLPRRLALREAGLRRPDGALGAPRRPLQPARAHGDPRSLLRRLGVRVGEPGRPGQASSRRKASSTRRSRTRPGSSAPPSRRLAVSTARAGRRARAKWRARTAVAAARAAARAPHHDLARGRSTRASTRSMRYMIPALHSVQYLYFVWLLKRNEARAAEGPPSVRPPDRPCGSGSWRCPRVGLGWLLFRGAPAFLDGALRLARRAADDATDAPRRDAVSSPPSSSS